MPEKIKQNTETVCVVGSANLDIVVPVPRHPVAGETVLGGDHSLVPGGKGANQAVAASRLGAVVAFIGAVGSDDAARTLTDSLSGAAVDCSGLLVTNDAPSGIALIAVGEDGDNSIVVSPGANARLTPAHVEAQSAALDAAVTLLQLETPVASVTRAAELATGTVVLNPAPAAPLPTELLACVDILVPNETELDLLGSGSTVEEKARSLGVPTVIVTLGAQGALIVTAHAVVAVAAPVVTPVDTTGAGDSFCGALASALATGDDLETAVKFAVRVGAATTLRPGAQPSLPTRSEIDQLLL